MPAPTKWILDFELANIQNPEGEPWLSASPDGRLALAYAETLYNPAARDIEETIYSANGAAQSSPNVTASSATDEHQPANAWLPDGRRVVVWTEEPRGGGGGEDVYAKVVFGNNVIDVPRFPVAGTGAGRQLDPVVAAGSEGFAIAYTDDSTGANLLVLDFFNIAGQLLFPGAIAPQTVNQLSADQYRDVEIAALANGNYVVVWASDTPYDIFAQIYAPDGSPVGGVIDVDPGNAAAAFPDVTALADGRFAITYLEFNTGEARGRIFNEDGAPAGADFAIASGAANLVNQQVETAALNDGRFVTVWLDSAGNISGQAMKADGTPDGAAFAVNGDGAGDKGRPTIATLADGRFAVSWESGSGATATIFSTIFEPRQAGLSAAATGLADDWIGTAFNDRVYLGAGNDRMDGAAGQDTLYGEAGQDTLNGGAGGDKLFGGNNNDTLDGGSEDDTLNGELGDDALHGTLGSDTLNGGEGDDEAYGGTEGDILNGQNGNDTLDGGIGLDVLHGGNGDDGLSGGADKDTLNGDANNDTLFGGDGGDTLRGGSGNDRMIGGLGGDVHLGGTGFDTFVFTAPDQGNDRIDDWLAASDQLEIDASAFGGGLAAGALAVNRLVVGAAPAATQAFGQFLYNTTTGQLSWDVDGTGATAAVAIARLLNGGVAAGTLSVTDFDIVA